MSMTTSRLKAWRKAKAKRATRHDRLGVVAVDVDDGSGDGLGDIGGIEARPGIEGRGREANLVVDDDVDGAAGPVAAQLGKVEDLGHDALAGEGGVAMEQDRAAPGCAPAGPASPAWPCTTPSRTGSTASRWLGLATSCTPIIDPSAVSYLPRESEVILDVARSPGGLGIEVAFEFAEDLGVALADHVGEDVEPPAVRHPDHRLLPCRRAAAAVSSESSIGMTDSDPSSPKRLCPTYLVWRKRSKASA